MRGVSQLKLVFSQNKGKCCKVVFEWINARAKIIGRNAKSYLVEAKGQNILSNRERSDKPPINGLLEQNKLVSHYLAAKY